MVVVVLLLLRLMQSGHEDFAVARAKRAWLPAEWVWVLVSAAQHRVRYRR